MNIFPYLRASEARGFRRWFNRRNSFRTRLVGWILLAFGCALAAAAYLGFGPTPARLYSGFAVALAAGLLCSHHGQRRRRYGWSHAGDWLILTTALVWMFTAVFERLAVGFGLAEFVIGILALAIFRDMRPLTALVLFPALTLIYGTLLWSNGHGEWEALINSNVAAVFAVTWSWSSYRSRIIEYRNQQLLRQLHRQNRELASLALRDALTGLPNRRYFEQVSARFWDEPGNAHQPLTLVLADIDHFKHYNDAHGHPGGDALLQQLAELLADQLRSGGVCARLGGEEFAILLERETTATGMTIAQRLAPLAERHLNITLSFGVASLQPAQGSLAQLYQAADDALYRAKHAGRNRIVVARPSVSLPEHPAAGAEATEAAH